MDEFEIKNKIHELRSLISSEWPGIEERKHMYQKLAVLEARLKELLKKKERSEENLKSKEDSGMDSRSGWTGTTTRWNS